MKKSLIILAILALALTSCGTAAEPTMDTASVQGTAMAAAMTMVAETQAAIPTATQIPPTEVPSATPFPTNTIEPLALASPTQGIAVLPTNTPVPASGSDDECNKLLTEWQGPSAQVRFQNSTKPKGTVTAWFWIQTNQGECGYISVPRFDNVTTITVPLGAFSTGAFVDGKKDFKVFGSGIIKDPVTYSLWVENDKIILKSGCAPNC